MPALRDDIDMVIVRENTEDLYIGKEFSLGNSAVALRVISEDALKELQNMLLKLQNNVIQ